jgi:hypothetical protein
MKNKISYWVFLGGLALTFLITSMRMAEAFDSPKAGSGSPSVVSYQGRVTLSGVPYNGTGYFKFALVDAVGSTSFWSNDGTSSGGGQPASAVAIPVSNGTFSILLGDTSLTNMSQPMTITVFGGNERYLRVWFSSDNVTFSNLSPDQRVAAVPYALQAQNADLLDGLDSSDFEQSGPTKYYPLLQAQNVDMAQFDASLKGYVGGFTDGRYAYFVPFHNGNAHFGIVARLDLQDFTVKGVSVLDLGGFDPTLKGFHGGFTDGRYGYFVPFYNGTAYSGKIARVDLQNFSPTGISTLDLTQVGAALKGFYGGFTDGRYGYLVPAKDGSNYPGALVRIDLQNFTTSGVSLLNLTAIDSGLFGFSGGFTDGRYGYLVPMYFSGGKAVRIDLSDFSANGVTILDWTTIDNSLVGFSSGFTDGRYGYYVPSWNSSSVPHGRVVRIDLNNFSLSGVTILDLTTVEPDLKGFGGGFSDGQYAYFVPGYPGLGKVARIDQKDFTAQGVDWIDLAVHDPSLRGFWGGFSDGRYGYMVPFYYWTGSLHWSGNVARIPLFYGGGAP